MVKVYGPMMSMGASGTLADTITFSKWKGRPYVRERVIPANPKSDNQVGRRIMFRFLTQEWKGMPSPEKAAFKKVAEQSSITPFNAFVQFNMNRWNVFDGPSQQYPPTETGTIGVVGVPNAAYDANQIHISSTGFTVNDNWGLVVHISAETGFPPAVVNARLVARQTTVAPLDLWWTPPKIETHYVRINCFTTDGVMGPAETEIEVSPPA